MTRPMKGRDGFTLLELLVAMTLLAAIMAILTGGFSLSLRSWESGKERMDGHYDITEGISLLAGQLRMAKRVFKEDERNNQALAFSGSAEKVEFVSTLPRLLASDKADGLYLQKIVFNPKTQSVLFGEGWFQPSLPPEKMRWSETEIGRGKIKSFRLEYLVKDRTSGVEDVYEWKDSVNLGSKPGDRGEWEFPKAVRMQIKTGGEKDGFPWPPVVALVHEGEEIKMAEGKR